MIAGYHPQLTGVAAITVSIRVYSATGELDIRRDPFTLGTRVLLTCDVTGLPVDSEVVSYRWYHNCTGHPTARCEIQDGDPYYRVVKDTLLLDVTSLNQGGRYYCTAPSLSVTQSGITRKLVVAGKSTLHGLQHAKILLRTVKYTTDSTVIGITPLQKVNDDLCMGSFVISFWCMMLTNICNTPST